MISENAKGIWLTTQPGKPYPVRVNISRREVEYDQRRTDHDCNEEFDLHITLKDDKNNRSFATVVISGGGLMAALGNRAEIRASLIFEDSAELLGLLKETKEVWIKAQPKLNYNDEPKLKKAWTHEGWMYSGGYNDHRRSEKRADGEYYRCELVRYVKAESEDEQE
jgi:hypothetical protein